MTTSHRSLRFLTFLTAMSLLLLGPVAFGASVSAADDLAPGSTAAEPLEVLGEVASEEALTDQGDTTEDVNGETAGAGSGSGSGGQGGQGTGGQGTSEEGEHGDEGTSEEGEHGEESAVLVCLATANPIAPYTAVLVMPTAVINGEGRVKKEGPANSPIGIAPADGWGNIVPTLTHPSGATFAGLNFGPAGLAIWEEGCGPDDPGTPPDDGHEGGGHGGHATVVVCIATEDEVTPYDVEEWMVQEIINGHGMPKKDGPASDPVEGVFPDGVWGNIIPVVTHPNKKATYPGLNLEDGGQAILDAGCVYVVPVALPPAPAVTPAAADFCPDLDGFQWENYDCSTPQAVAVEVAVPTEPLVAVVAPSTGTTPESAQPTAVSVPEAGTAPLVAAAPETSTIPAAVDAGGGSSDPTDGLTWVACLFILSCLGAAGSASRLVSSGASLR